MADKDEWADFDELAATTEATKAQSSGRQSNKDARKQAKQQRKEQWRETAASADSTSPALRVAGILAVLAVFGGIAWATASFANQRGESLQLTKPGDTTNSSSSTAGAVPSPSSTLGLGTNPQAAVPADPTKKPQAVQIPTPQAVTADPQQADQVAQAWAKGYLSRGEAGENAWRGFITPYTAEELLPILDTLAFQGSDPLAGKEPTQVLEVKVLPAPKGEPVDTPTRWTRNLEVPVQSHDGSTTVITYTVTSYLGEKGWQVTDAVQKFWTAS
ncbi:hypothetical protein [Pseudarthrobacter sp. J47]|uniref:hypothetical protein n=1 Tax=Pseudarthrobacter sp. J47 TaxID=3116482 RepID=UPI002E80EF2C|nr:hypothetical protein [Pseudarthrobacter sp. J47]MEE2524539.1 hypothetical protein [Pseudarthrobacter sp. J47]